MVRLFISRKSKMNYKTILLLFSLLSLGTGCKQQEEAPLSHPNIVFFLIDDLGWNDLTCYGSSFYETPHIDQLASHGTQFMDAYASCPVCSPTRASILTGKYPARLNITDWIPGLDPQNQPLLGTQDLHELPLEEMTMAEVFKQEGYATGFFGKWHLGEPGFFPENQGFDLNIGGHWAGQPASYFYPYKNKRKRWDVPGLVEGMDGEYLTDRLTDEAIEFMESHQNQPFFVYLSHYAVHTPIQSKKELETKYTQKKEFIRSNNVPDYLPERNAQTKQIQDNSAYAGMVESVDESVGKIIKALEELNLKQNTIIVFTSDNGGLTTLPGNRKSPTSVTPLRAGKGWLYEGGIRVPLIFTGPRIKSQKVSTLTTSTDLFPTLLNLAQLPPRPEFHQDGKDLTSILLDQANDEKRNLYWHFPHYHGSGNRPSAAIRSDRYKLIHWFENDSIELYDLHKDLKERNNLRDSMPQITTKLKEQLTNWQREVKAQFPSKNPNFSASE